MDPDRRHRMPYIESLRRLTTCSLRRLSALDTRLTAIVLVLGLCVAPLLLGGCDTKRVERAELGYDIDSAYMMLTRDVDMLVSDSGYTRYRLLTPLWLIYDRPDRKQWLFPEGITMRSVDSVAPASDLVYADSAIFYVEEERWELIGNVRIDGLKGEKLYTPHLHWLRRDKRLYSDDTTYFATEGRELRGQRFEAADDLSWYNIYGNSGDFDVREREPSPTSEVGDSTRRQPTSTTPTAPPSTTR